MGSEAVVSPVASGRVVVTAKAPVAKPAARMAVYFIVKVFGRGYVGWLERLLILVTSVGVLVSSEWLMIEKFDR